MSRALAAVLACTSILLLAPDRSVLAAGPGDPPPLGRRGLPPVPIGWQDTESTSDWQDVWMTGREIWFHVSHPTPREGLTWAGVALAAAVLERDKIAIEERFRSDAPGAGNALSSRVRPLGEAIVPAAALATYAIGRFSGSEKTRRVGLILSESAIFTVLATEVGQFVLSEQRPEEGGRLRFFKSGGHGVSGHTSIVAAMSVPLDRLFFHVEPGDGGWLRAAKYAGKGVVYAAPVLTGWSRMHDDRHYAWNVLLGLGAGFAIGDMVSDAHGLGDRDDSRAWSLVPTASDRGAPGLALRWSTR